MPPQRPSVETCKSIVSTDFRRLQSTSAESKQPQPQLSTVVVVTIRPVGVAMGQLFGRGLAHTDDFNFKVQRLTG